MPIGQLACCERGQIEGSLCELFKLVAPGVLFCYSARPAEGALLLVCWRRQMVCGLGSLILTSENRGVFRVP